MNMNIKELNDNTKNNLNKIYKEIYQQINEQNIDIFLCGGASSQKSRSVRDRLRKKLEVNTINLRIHYPEDLFIEMLNTNKKCDLLSLEGFLADNCDYICIICESPGSFVELGAFSNNKKTINKVIPVIEEKYKKKKSFIMLGPIKLISKLNNDNVIYYLRDDIKDLSSKLIKRFKCRKSTNNVINKNIDINTMIGFYHFIPLILYLYNNLTIKNIVKMLTYVLNKHKNINNNFDTILSTSLRLLFNDKIIKKNIIKDSYTYSLTTKGYKKLNDTLKNTKIKNKTLLLDSIRFDIMNTKYYSNELLFP